MAARGGIQKGTAFNPYVPSWIAGKRRMFVTILKAHHLPKPGSGQKGEFIKVAANTYTSQ